MTELTDVATVDGADGSGSSLNGRAAHGPEQHAVPQAGKAEKRPAVTWILALAALIGVAALAWWVGASSQSPDQAAARAQEPVASWITVPVEFRVLSATLITRGDVRAEARTDVAVPVSVEGVPVLTRKLVETGDAVLEGDQVAEVSGRPIFVFQGAIPIYRSLQPGMSGDDVAALQDALLRLGSTIPVDERGTFGTATKDAVETFYQSAGYEALATSTTFESDKGKAQRAVRDAEAAVATARVAIADTSTAPTQSAIALADESIAAAQRAIQVAQSNEINDVAVAQSTVTAAVSRRIEVQENLEATDGDLNDAFLAVDAAERGLAQTQRSTADAVASAEADLRIAKLTRADLDATSADSGLGIAVQAAQVALDDATAELAALLETNGPKIPLGEVVFVDTTPARVVSASTSLQTATNNVGAGPSIPSSPGTVVSLASGDLVVTATIRPGDIALVGVGTDVELLDELAQVSYRATIEDVATEPSIGNDGQLAYTITVMPAEALPDSLAGANVRMTMISASTDQPQLIVPLAAVSSSADGSTRVSVLDPTSGTPVEVPVTASLSAGGFVAVEPTEPNGLTTNDQVIVGR